MREGRAHTRSLFKSLTDLLDNAPNRFLYPTPPDARVQSGLLRPYIKASTVASEDEVDSLGVTVQNECKECW